MQKHKTCARAGLILLGLMAPGGARADAIAPLDLPLGNAEFTLGGEADAVGTADDDVSGSGALRLNPRLERDYDSGLVLDVRARLLAYHDRLSAGRYGGDLFESVVGEVKSGLGSVAVGLTDGAAHALALGVPRVDDAVTLDDPELLLTRDHATGRPLNFLFPTSAVSASSNYAKFVYTSPTLFGVTLALSFAPTEGKDVLPFLREGPQVANRQADIWEIGLRYSDIYGPVTLSAYGGAAEGRAERKTPGHEGMSDLGAGARADYAVADGVTLSLGGGFRQSNEDRFDINDVLASAVTRSVDAGASVTVGNWVAGVEYGDAVAGGARERFNGVQASVGYKIDENLRLTGGWQHKSENPALAGGPRAVDAGFLHLDFHV